MMEFIRERAKGLVAMVIIGLLCLTFLLWGIESYISAAQQVVVAKVNGEDIPLTDVVLGMQKSSLSFEATLQVRNKVLRAYEDIINMPV